MWTGRGIRSGASRVAAEALRWPAPPEPVRLCRRCLSRAAQSSIKKSNRPGVVEGPMPGRRLAHRVSTAESSTATQPVEPEPPVFVSQEEADQAKLLDSAKKKVDEYYDALSDTREDMTVSEQKDRARIMKELGPLAGAWEQYMRLKTAIIEAEKLVNDPDPSMREMFQLEHEGLLAEFNELVTVSIPRHILPPLPAAPLPAMMNLTAGIGGGESARFLEELSKMYRRYAEKKGWKVEVLSSTEGAMAKGAGGNGFREMTLKYSPSDWGEEGAECFGELMWEKGVHRVQRVPPGSTVNIMQSSTVNCAEVSPIYPDTEEEPLLDPKDVKEEVMRSRGPGGQNVNKTESAIRLTHVSGISVSMQDSRSQAQNRERAWDVLRARMSEKRRTDEQERRSANRLTAIKGSNRGDKVRTWNWPQDRMTDHRIGYTTNGLGEILSGENFGTVVDAMKNDFAERRIEALLQGEEDLLE